MGGCVLVWVTLTVVKHHDQKQLGNKKVYLDFIGEFLRREAGLSLKVIQNVLLKVTPSNNDFKYTVHTACLVPIIIN